MELPPQRIDQLWRDLRARQAWDRPYAILYFDCLEVIRGDVPASIVLCRILTLLARSQGAKNSVRLCPTVEEAFFDGFCEALARLEEHGLAMVHGVVDPNPVQCSYIHVGLTAKGVRLITAQLGQRAVAERTQPPRE